MKGVLDLRTRCSEPFTADLEGEWRLYWNRPRSIDSLPLLTPDGYFSVPGYWNEQTLNGSKLPALGFATFALTILIDSECIDRHLALKTPDQLSAYTVWIDGREVSSSGKAGTDEQTTVSRAGTNLITFIPESQKVEIVMRISNFSISGAGPHHAPVIGTTKELFNRFSVRQAFDLLFLGALLFSGLFHLGLYSLRREMHSYLYFALFALCWALRFFIEGIHSRPITFIFPQLSYELLSRLEIIAAVPTSWLLLLFVNTLFAAHKLTNWLRFSSIITLALSAASIFAPILFLANILLAFELFSFLLVIPLYVTIIRAIQNRCDGAWLVLVGTIFFTLTALNDTLYSLRLVNTMYLISTGVVFLTLCFSAVLSRRFANAYSSAKSLSEELDSKNRSLQQLDSLKDEFIANTSHELRTPLQGIVGLADGLLHTAESPKQISGLSLIAASGRRLTHLINDIQDFSRIKNKELALNFRPVDISSCISTVLALAQYLLRSDKVRLINNIPDGFPQVIGDEVRIEQIFYNLVGNAIKYTDSGSINISGNTVDSMAHITVEDTGAGIRQDKLESIFKPYEQAGISLHQNTGTGIGLSITRHLVELHGGSITVQSRYGEGSSFTVTLSLASEDRICEEKGDYLLSSVLPDISFSGIPGKKPLPIKRKPGSILVVDDDLVNRRVFATIIGAQYTEVLEAGDGYEALELLNRHTVDVVLLDIMMPRMDGYATLKEIRKMYSTIELPVLLVTAKNRSIDLVTGFGAGANDYLTKPCGSEELLARIDSQMHVRYNAALQKEKEALTALIETERQVQKQSLISLEKLQFILDIVSEPVALIDETYQFCYANRTFCSRAGIDPGRIKGIPVNEVSGDSALVNFLEHIFSNGNGGNYKTGCIRTKIGKIYSLVRCAPVAAGDEMQVILSPGRIAVCGQENEFIVSDEKSAESRRRRECARKAVCEAVRCWSEETGLEPLELARQSGLWKIHMNPDGWERAKTLDRYLSNSNFPQNPRLKTVNATVAFVLDSLGTQSPNYKYLHGLFEEIQKWL